jgi:signal peptidase I
VKKNLILFSLSILLFTVSCSAYSSSIEVIKDLNTDQKPQKRITELGEHIMSFSVPDDTMERDGGFPEKVVVDLSTGTETISRGDIVYVEFPKDMKEEPYRKFIIRIVGLPGEEITIEQGQIYVDDKVLDTFYGREYHHREPVEKSEVNMDNSLMLENHYFVMADQWWRSNNNSNQIGSIPAEYIKGKVIGYTD